MRRAALVIDIREGCGLKQFPAIYKKLRRRVPATLVYLEADDSTLVRRFSETRRPHPLGITYVGIEKHPGRARAAGAHPRCGRPYHQYLEIQRA